MSLTTAILAAKKKTKRLPAEFQQVEYIESTGSQYIITEFTPNQDSRVLVDFQYVEQANAFVFGSRVNTLQRAFSLGIGNATKSFQSLYGSSGASVIEDADTERHLVDKDKESVYLDGELSFTHTSYTFTCPAPMRIFACYQNTDSAYLPSKLKLYSMTIWENGVLNSNFIPCYRKSDEKVGLYDTVSNQFYGNAGTGDFLAGNDIN